MANENIIQLVSANVISLESANVINLGAAVIVAPELGTGGGWWLNEKEVRKIRKRLKEEFYAGEDRIYKERKEDKEWVDDLERTYNAINGIADPEAYEALEKIVKPFTPKKKKSKIRPDGGLRIDFSALSMQIQAVDAMLALRERQMELARDEEEAIAALIL